MNLESATPLTTPVVAVAADQSKKESVRGVAAPRLQPNDPPIQQHEPASHTVSSSTVIASLLASSQESPVTKEEDLSIAIKTLFVEEEKRDARVQKTAAALADVRRELGEKLFELKALVCVPGRKGGWSAKCAELGIPKRSADRLAKNHGAAISKSAGKLANGQVSEPWTKADLDKMAIKVATKIATIRHWDGSRWSKRNEIPRRKDQVAVPKLGLNP